MADSLSREEALAIVNDLTLAMGSEVHLDALLTKVLQRMLYHTTFPVGVMLLDQQLAGEVIRARLAKAIGDYQIQQRVGTLIELPADLLNGTSRWLPQGQLEANLLGTERAYPWCLSLSVDKTATMLLFSAKPPTSRIPFTHLFLPVLKNLSKAILLCRSYESETLRLSTERDQARQELLTALRRTEQERALLRSLLNTIPDLVWLKDTEGAYLACNPEFERLYGHPEAEIVGKTDYDFVDRETAKFFQDHDRAAMAAGKSTLNEEWLHYAADGHRALVSTTKTPMHAADGTLIGVLGIAHDITDMRRKEEALLASQTALKRAQAVARIGSWQLDIPGEVLRWSDETYRIFGLATGTPLTLQDFAEHIHSQDRPRVRKAWNAAIRGEPFDIDHRILVDGAVRWVREVTRVEFDPHGHPVAVVGTVQDIDDRKLAEISLWQSEERFRKLFDESRQPMMLLEAGYFVDANSATLEHLGYRSLHEFVGITPEQISPEYQPDGALSSTKAPEMVRIAIEKGSHRFDWEHMKYHGEHFFADVMLTPIQFGERTVIHVVWTDITERKLLEAQMQRFVAIVNSSDDAIISKTLDGRVTSWNPGAEALFGWTAAEMVGHSIRGLIPHDRAREEDVILDSIRNGQTVEHFETKRLLKDGGVIDVSVTISPIHDDWGNVVGASKIARDITQRKLYEEELRKLSLSVEQSSNTIVITNLKAEIEYVNSRFTEVTGYSRQEALGKNPRLLKSGRTPANVYADLWNSLAHGTPWKGELVNRRKDGSEFEEWVQISPLRNEQGTITHYVAIKEDITAKKRTERELETYRKHLEELVQSRTAELEAAKLAAETANRAKSEFVANMSHEIRTPMNAILGYASLLEKKPLEPEQRDLARKIHASGETLLGIINDILDFSKIEAGRLTVEQVPFRLSVILDELAGLLSSLSGAKPLETVIRPVPKGADHLRGDPLRVKQVLVNLASNAVKFTERGEVVVEATVVEAAPDRVVIRFAVRDTGIGIVETQQASIFSAFSQADGSTTRRFGGTGLGLSICQNLVGLMGGDIGVNSVPGQGSEFWFVLPFEICPATEMDVPERHKPLRVLIVDDLEVARDALRDMALNLGWDVATADSGLAGIEYCAQRIKEEKPFDLVLMDWRMPGMDGLETSQALRGIYPAFSQPIIIMVTAYDREQLSTQPGAAVLDAFLCKPVTASALNDAATCLMNGRSAIRRAQSAPSGNKPLAGITVLVVDDNETNREVAQLNLEEQGAEVMLAVDGREALEWLTVHPGSIDLVLMDVQMPIMDGYEATRRIRELPESRQLPVIALSAGAFKEQREAALVAGMDGFLAKPFDMGQVIATLLEFCGGQARAPLPIATPEKEPVEPVLDMQRGLTLWKEQATYHKHLRRFVESYATADAEIGGFLSQGDHQAAIALAHKLKGVAGNLALLKVAGCAGQIEQSLTGGNDAGEFIQPLCAALTEAVAEIRRLTDNAATITAPRVEIPVDLAGAAPLLSELLVALDRACLDEIEAVMTTLKAKLPESMLRPLCEAVDNFDFMAAETETGELAACLGIRLGLGP